MLFRTVWSAAKLYRNNSIWTAGANVCNLQIQIDAKWKPYVCIILTMQSVHKQTIYEKDFTTTSVNSFNGVIMLFVRIESNR